MQGPGLLIQQPAFNLLALGDIARREEVSSEFEISFVCPAPKVGIVFSNRVLPYNMNVQNNIHIHSLVASISVHKFLASTIFVYSIVLALFVKKKRLSSFH